MIVDTSALIALLKNEPTATRIAHAIGTAEDVRIGAPTLTEAYLVAGERSVERIERLIGVSGIRVEPFTSTHARLARDAHRRFGRGSGSRARLNFGDCMSYAVAAHRDEPLLFVGDDFTHTDITSAL